MKKIYMKKKIKQQQQQEHMLWVLLRSALYQVSYELDIYIVHRCVDVNKSS